MKITNRSFPRPPFFKDLNTYAVKDKKYTTTVATITIKRFGPSGSVKNENIALERTRAVTAKMSNETFFDL